MVKLKEQLYILCAQYIKNKELEIRTAIKEAQEAAINEAHSAAGDQFEPGVESMQQEIEVNLARLTELKNQQYTLDEIVPAQTSSTVAPGSLVFTNNGNYYISIGAGRLSIDGQTFFAVSAASPIGTQLAGHTAGHQFDLNGRKITIEKVA